MAEVNRAPGQSARRQRQGAPAGSQVIMFALILLAMVLRCGYLAVAPKGAQFDHVDAQGYHWLAVNLLDQGIFSMNTEPPFRADSIRAPLYPLYVASWYAVGGPSPALVGFSHVLLDLLTVAVVYRLGKSMAGNRVGAAAALLYAINPSSWRFCNELLTEIPFGLLLTVSVWMFARYIRCGHNRDAWRCGISFGLAILCKPNVQFLPLALLAIMVHGFRAGRRQWWQGVLIVAGTISLLLFPWVVRNRLVFDDWFYTRTFDDNLAHVSAVSALAEARGEQVAPWSPRWEEIYGEIIVRTALRYDWTELDDRDLSAQQRDLRLQQIKAISVEIIRAHPVDFLVSHMRGWLWSFVPQEHKFWYTRLTGDLWQAIPTEGDAFGRALRMLTEREVRPAVQILIEERLLALPPLALVLWLGWGLDYAVAAVLFAIGALRIRPRILSLFIVLTIFYVTFVPGPISQTRFRLPVTPLILVVVACGALGGRAIRSDVVRPMPG